MCFKVVLKHHEIQKLHEIPSFVSPNLKPQVELKNPSSVVSYNPPDVALPTLPTIKGFILANQPV